MRKTGTTGAEAGLCKAECTAPFAPASALSRKSKIAVRFCRQPGTYGKNHAMSRLSCELPQADATTAELLREFVRARCGTAFAELVRRYAGLVTGTALRVTGSREAAEDVAQEVF